jgi:hypothetical protein
MLANLCRNTSGIRIQAQTNWAAIVARLPLPSWLVAERRSSLESRSVPPIERILLSFSIVIFLAERIDLPAELHKDLRAAERDYYDVVCYTHLDDDHCCGTGDFFWLEHALKYQGEGRIKIRELWVPAAAILEDGCEDSARIVRQEARHRGRTRQGREGRATCIDCASCPRVGPDGR